MSVALHELLSPDQEYVCLWSHAGWEPVHIHFVLQPSWNSLREQYEHPGPCLQRDMLHADALPPRQEVEAFAARMRDRFSRR